MHLFFLHARGNVVRGRLMITNKKIGELRFASYDCQLEKSYNSRHVTWHQGVVIPHPVGKELAQEFALILVKKKSPSVRHSIALG